MTEHQRILEQRYKELQREAERRAEDPKITRACEDCKFGSAAGFWCQNALVLGSDKEKRSMEGSQSADAYKYCTPERVLWQPRGSKAKARMWFSSLDEETPMLFALGGLITVACLLILFISLGG